LTTLELDPTKSHSREDVRAAYLMLSRKYHSDKNLDAQDTAKEKFQEISGAYELLKDRDLTKKAPQPQIASFIQMPSVPVSFSSFFSGQFKAWVGIHQEATEILSNQNNAPAAESAGTGENSMMRTPPSSKNSSFGWLSPNKKGSPKKAHTVSPVNALSSPDNDAPSTPGSEATSSFSSPGSPDTPGVTALLRRLREKFKLVDNHTATNDPTTVPSTADQSPNLVDLRLPLSTDRRNSFDSPETGFTSDEEDNPDTSLTGLRKTLF